MILHLDIHLHRIEIIYLKQGDYLTVADSIAITEKGLVHLYREWVEAIAQEFVRNTRFDPLHKAASEQELYDRLPAVLTNFRHNTSTVFEISAKATSYNIALKRDLLARKAGSLLDGVEGDNNLDTHRPVDLSPILPDFTPEDPIT